MSANMDGCSSQFKSRHGALGGSANGAAADASAPIRIFPVSWNFRFTRSARRELENTENPDLTSNGPFLACDLEEFRIFAQGLDRPQLSWSWELTSDSHATVVHFVTLE